MVWPFPGRVENSFSRSAFPGKQARSNDGTESQRQQQQHSRPWKAILPEGAITETADRSYLHWQTPPQTGLTCCDSNFSCKEQFSVILHMCFNNYLLNILSVSYTDEQLTQRAFEFYAGVYRECQFMTSVIYMRSGPCKQDFLKSLSTFKMCP